VWVIERGVVGFEGIVVDTRDWPILIMELPEGRVPDAAVRESLAHIERLMRETPPGSKFFQLTDLSRMTELAPATQRKYAAEWSASTEALARRCRVGGAVVATSAMVRGILTAVFWLNKASSPTTVVATRNEGLRSGLAALERVLSPLPQNLAAMKARL
jgi:hypothetical protein